MKFFKSSILWPMSNISHQNIIAQPYIASIITSGKTNINSLKKYRSHHGIFLPIYSPIEYSATAQFYRPSVCELSTRPAISTSACKKCSNSEIHILELQISTYLILNAKYGRFLLRKFITINK